jgi:hypothetical protein
MAAMTTIAGEESMMKMQNELPFQKSWYTVKGQMPTDVGDLLERSKELGRPRQPHFPTAEVGR